MAAWLPAVWCWVLQQTITRLGVKTHPEHVRIRNREMKGAEEASPERDEVLSECVWWRELPMSKTPEPWAHGGMTKPFSGEWVWVLAVNADVHHSLSSLEIYDSMTAPLQRPLLLRFTKPVPLIYLSQPKFLCVTSYFLLVSEFILFLFFLI